MSNFTFLVSAVSFDSRRHTIPIVTWKKETPPQGNIDIRVGINKDNGCLSAPLVPISLSSFDQAAFNISAADFPSSLLTVALHQNESTLSTTSVSLKDHKIESLCGEISPKGGRIIVDLDIATVVLESVLITPFHHPLAHVPSTNTVLSTPGSTILVGHRGIGMNRVLFAEGSTLPHIGENTIDSFQEALKEGVQFVEFDAQVSKDLDVVLYHDSIVSEYPTHTEIKDLTTTQFLSTTPKFGASPFTTLKAALEALPLSLGFNIEIKYPMPEEIETDKLSTIEYNVFVDAVLKTSLEYGGERAIVFSCFNPEACRMAKVKQSRYPVLFLTMGGAHPAIDLRSNTFLAAAEFAKLAGLDGIVTDATPVVHDPVAQIKAAKEILGDGKVVFTYGAPNCVPGNAGVLQSAELDGIIVDTVVQVREELKVSD
ncbi:UNVERIFIED_CONTAM: Glycerophosphocholine phosphodiesterase [Siphonaria sp. JEL0065]|nr:Glycerophosphocholine phosphodiesterase [Siphonaria sp. JEL0065]